MSAGRETQLASTAPPIFSPTQNGCALHVWPAADAESSYMGWFHGGAVNGDKRGIKGYPDLHSQVLTTAIQKQLLAGMDWATLLASPGLTVVIHDLPPDAQDDQKRTFSLISDRPACYEELLIHTVFVERAALSSTTVRVTLIVKRWGDRQGMPHTYGSMASQRTNLDDQDLKSGFVASVEKILNSNHFRQFQTGGK